VGNGRTGTGLDSCEYCTIVARRSTDGGKTWPVKKLINEGPSGYSVSVQGKDGTLFLLYEKGDNVYYDQGVSIAKLNMKWLLDGK
jgi:sialidase-1